MKKPQLRVKQAAIKELVDMIRAGYVPCEVQTQLDYFVDGDLYANIERLKNYYVKLALRQAKREIREFKRTHSKQRILETAYKLANQ